MLIFSFILFVFMEKKRIGAVSVVLPQPFSRTIGQRIRESLKSHIPLEVSGVPLYDEPAGEVSKNMDPDPAFSFRLDKLDRAQMVLDSFGSSADSDRVSRDATTDTKTSNKEGVKSDSGQE